MRKIFAITACILSLNSYAELSFTESSPTASGKWVKIEVTESGIYEISFDELRAMGFENPEKVALFGNGGRQHPENFADGVGRLQGYSGLNQVPTMVADNKIIFYGRGVEDINYKRDTKYELGGIFDRTSFNIYSFTGHYLLSDAVEPLYVATETAPNNPTIIEYLMDYRYFEEDLSYNPQNSGQIYWGRVFKYGNDTETYPVQFADVDTDYTAVAQCAIFFNDYTLNIPLTFGFPENNSFVETKNYDSPVYSYLNVPNSIGQIQIPGEETEFSVQYKTRNNSGEGYLDFWMVTFRKKLPTLVKEHQSRGVANSISSGRGFIMKGLPSGTIAWNLSNPDMPTQGANNNNDISMTAKVSYPKIIFFNPEKEMKHIKGYTEVANQDLHQRAAQGAELLIITTKSMLPYAQEIARLHEAHDGISVMVATVEEIYNEYSSGTPEVMAYKWLAKSLYQNEEHKLKNILLFGPITSELRGVKRTKDSREYIIAHQQKSINRTIGATNSNDFLGVMVDYIDDSLQKATMEVGVGVLPVRNETQATNCIDKIKRYLEEEDFAFFNNQFIWWSCPGDEHMHDISANATGRAMNVLTDNMLIEHPIVANNYSDVSLSRQEFFNQFSTGHLINIYFGHGDPTGLAVSQDLLTPVHLLKLNNSRLPFTFFAGCSIANFDRGDSGIGEKMILDMKSGSVGALIATRETYNNENKRFMTTFLQALLLEQPEVDSPRSEVPLTLGEAFARFKTATNAVNEFSYQLMCDPALVLPVPRLSMSVMNQATAAGIGNKLKLKGHITHLDGEKVENFNGKIVARLMDPFEEVKSQDMIITEKSEFIYNKGDVTVNLAVGEVKNGDFECTLLIPFNITPKEGASIALSAYDMDTHESAAFRYTVDLVEDPGYVKPEDSTPPVISNLVYDPNENTISFDASDDTALDLCVDPFRPAIELKLDGSPLSPYMLAPMRVENEGKEASFCISLPKIFKGEHSAHLNVSDMAGNRTRQEFVFSTNEEIPVFALSISEDADSEGITLQVDGDIEGAKLYVSDYANNTVCIVPVDGKEIRWDFTTAEGKRLPTGLYRLHISSAKGYSQQILVPVIHAYGV